LLYSQDLIYCTLLHSPGNWGVITHTLLRKWWTEKLQCLVQSCVACKLQFLFYWCRIQSLFYSSWVLLPEYVNFKVGKWARWCEVKERDCYCWGVTSRQGLRSSLWRKALLYSQYCLAG
jgi:hypothetical protein